jgi:predicted metalloprotease
MRRPRGHRGPLLLALGLACLALAGCGDEDEDSADSGDSPDALTAQPAAGEGPKGISYGDYEAGIEDIVLLLEEYWTETLPAEFDVEYSSPSDVIPYYPEEGAPECGGEPLGPENAFYCGANDIIAWDEPGLMIPFYADVGDAAVGFVLGHEWGHLVQNRLEADFPITIEQELNADCLSGSFAGALQEEGLLEGGESLEPGTDLYEAAVGIYDFGDHPSVHWQDPDAHGQPKQRLRAFEVGYDGGAQACADELGPGFTDEL